MRVPLCPAVHGHIADSVRDHEPGPGSRIALDEEAEGAVHRTAGSWISMARCPPSPRSLAGRRSGPHGPRACGVSEFGTGPDLGFYAARSYSLMRPPRTGRRLI